MIGVDDLNVNVGAYINADAPYSALGPNSWVQTPNIDALAARGMMFTRAYTNHTICNPSRVSFMTGLYSETTGILSNTHDPDAPGVGFVQNAVTFPEVYQNAGYYTAAHGKLEHGRYSGRLDLDELTTVSRDAFTPDQVVAQGDGFNGRFAWKSVDTDNDSLFRDGIIADRVVASINSQKDRDEPFFIHAGFNKPHEDWNAPKQFFDAHPASEAPLMPQGIDPSDQTRGVTEGRNGFPEISDAQERQLVAAYAAATSFMDSQVGRVLQTLEDNGLADSTAIIFYSDHGFSLGEHDQFGKVNQFESTARIPFIIAAPGVTPGTSDSIVELVDMFPTLMEFSGLQAPHLLEGDSLLPILQDPSLEVDGTALTVFGGNQDDGARNKSLTTTEYRYISYFNGTDALFHIDDLDETVDLSLDPSYSGVIADLQQQLATVRQVTELTAVPEPASITLLMMMVFGVALRSRPES